MKIFNNLSFRLKLLSIVILACLICGTVAVGVGIHYNNIEFEDGIVSKSQVIHDRLDAAAKFVAEQGGLKSIQEYYLNKYKDPSELSEEDKSIILKQVPIVAAMVIGADGAEKNNYEFRIFSDEPRNKENAATTDELTIFKKFEKDTSLKEWVESKDNQITVYRPVRLSEERGCLSCHGHPSTSPWGNGRDILGYKMENWKDGKLHGVFAVKNDIGVAQASIAASHGGFSSTTMLILFIMLGGSIAVGIASVAIRSPINSLANVSASLASIGKEVSSASVQIASSSEQLAQSATEQASSLEETSASLEEISSMIARAAESAKSTSKSSQESLVKAEEGKVSVEQMRNAMNEINMSNEAIIEQVNISNQKMTEIVQVIQEIGTKTKVINDIVFQTKLLSFNASVEAARAGEAGKGFAVVAEEVGNLAQMSGNAAKDIGDMLESSITRVEAIVEDTKQQVEKLVLTGKSKVENGIEVSERCATILGEIVANTSTVSDLAREISNATSEQALGVAEINKAVTQLDTVTQQNSSASESTASSAAQLNQQAGIMRDEVMELIRVVQGAHAIIAQQEEKKIQKMKLVRNVPEDKNKKKEDSMDDSKFVDL